MPAFATDTKFITVGELRKRVNRDERPDEANLEPIALPRWQRSLVWSEASQRDLIDSVREGFPIGSLLAHQDRTTEGRLELLLIDGLQRTNALITHSERPLDNVQATDFNEEDVAEILRGIGEGYSDEEVSVAQHLLSTWAASLKNKKEFDAWGLVRKLGGTNLGNEDVAEHARALIEHVNDVTDIDDFTVPLLVYTGDAGNLPAIFERLNRQGTKLSDYEVFAASWSAFPTFTVSNAKIRQKIVERYSEAQDRGFEVQDMPDGGSDQPFHLFEYLFGLDHLLADVAPDLFAIPKSVTEVRGYAFNLTSLVLGVKIPDMKDGLPTAFPRSGRPLEIQPEDLENHLIEATQFVADSLSPILGLKLNQKGREITASMPEYLAYSLVGRAFVGRWKPIRRGDGSVERFEVRDGYDTDWRCLRSGIRRRYLQDLVNKEWRGQLQGLAWKRIWGEATKTQRPTAPDSRLAEPLDWVDLDRDLDSWFEDQLERTLRERPNISAEEKTFLRFVYANLISHAQDQGVVFEIDHLFPVNCLSEQIPDDDDGWPISCIANLAVLPKDVNRARKDRTFPDYLDSLDDDERTVVMSKVEDLLLCSVEDLGLPASGTLTKADYEAFLRSRWETIKQTTSATLDELDGGPAR